MRLIDADEQYERGCNLEAQALDYVGKLIERDGDEVSVEWKIWSAILTERTAFKHDVFDAPTIDAVEVVHGEWTEKEVIQDKVIEEWQSARCSNCGRYHTTPYMYYFDDYDFCPNCGAMMKGERNEVD